MKFSASLLLLSALGIGGGADRSVPAAAQASNQEQQVGASYPEPLPSEGLARVSQDIPPVDEDAPRATSGEDAARYDEVGFASWYGEELGPDARTASGRPFDPAMPIAAHKTLPLGSFIEVTALDSGRTILVEVADRGPHRADRLVDLSRGAAQQLGTHAASIAPVRVRQVQPSMQDIAALRGGGSAPKRLGAPEVLLSALRKRLPGKADVVPVAKATPASNVAPPAVSASARPAPTGRYRVQVAAFSTEERARALANRIDGIVARAGKFHRVQLGPFATRADAKQARDRVAAQGYGDAQIVSTD